MNQLRKWMLMLVFLVLGFLSAEELKVAIAAEPPAMDPHFSRTSPNQAIAAQFFDTLVPRDKNLRQIPGLVESWESDADYKVWTLKLRAGVKFHDGSTFDAADVVFTAKRIPMVENSPASFDSSVSSIDTIEAVDPLTVKVTLKKSEPFFIETFGSLYVLPSELGLDVKTQDFNEGRAMVGTGPYIFDEWRRGEVLKMHANKDYWRGKPFFDKVTVTFISNGPSRLAALLSGSVDMIDDVPSADYPRLKKNPKITIWDKASVRMIYLHMDSSREQTPFITDKKGNPIRNPLLDRRVRQAISLLLNRDAIVARVMQGQGEATGQFVPEGLVGYVSDLPAPKQDVAMAKKLLAQAGYPDGFRITVHGPNNRYQNDASVVQAVAQFLARGGIEAKVEVMPKNIFFGRASKREFSLFLVGFGSVSGSSLRGLMQVAHTYDKAAGMGLFNRGRYSNAQLDTLLERAEKEGNMQRHEQLLQQATRLLMNDYGIIPLHFELLSWAGRKGIQFTPSRREQIDFIDVSRG